MQVRCRCGFMDKEMDCSKLSTRADDARCEKQCSKKRDCLRHKCGQKCCILLEHVCPLVITIFNKTHFFHAKKKFRKAFCYQKLFWPFTVWIDCSSDLKKFANSWPSASNFKSFSRSLEQFFLTVGQNNFGNKIPIFQPFFYF